MNTYLRRIKKNSKALSPVVASIILIAVTVAVSVVVAAWMGGMSLGLMGNAEQLSVTNVEFRAGIAGDDTVTPPIEAVPAKVVVSIQNNGGAASDIDKVYINGGAFAGTISPTTLAKGDITDVTVEYTWLPNTSYELKFTTTKGNNIAYTQVSPAA